MVCFARFVVGALAAGNFGILADWKHKMIGTLQAFYNHLVRSVLKAVSYRLPRARLVEEGPFFQNIRAFFRPFLGKALFLRFLFFLLYHCLIEKQGNPILLEAFVQKIVSSVVCLVPFFANHLLKLSRFLC